MVTLREIPLDIFEHGSDAVNMMNGGFHLLAQFHCHLETKCRTYQVDTQEIGFDHFFFNLRQSNIGNFMGFHLILEKGLSTCSSIVVWRIQWKRNLAGYGP